MKKEFDAPKVFPMRKALICNIVNIIYKQEYELFMARHSDEQGKRSAFLTSHKLLKMS